MPARDIYHNHVKNALIKSGWEITHDPLHLKWGLKDMYVDLGAELLLGAQKENRKIAVEIKSFVSSSTMRDFENAIGQYIVYYNVMGEVEPDRELYLAIHEEIFIDIFEEPIGSLLLKKQQLRLLVFNVQKEEVIKWIP